MSSDASFETKRPAIVSERAKIALDAHWIANANLDVVFRRKACILVEAFTFEKGGADSVEWLIAFLFARGMEKADDRAISLSQKQIRSV